MSSNGRSNRSDRSQNRNNSAGQSEAMDSRPKRMPRGAGVYPKDLVPIALGGDYVRLKPEDQVRKVETVTSNPSIRAFQTDLSNGLSISGNSTDSDNAANALEQRRNWLAQYRLVDPEQFPAAIDEVQVDLGGSQAPMYTSKNARGFINEDTAQILGITGATDLYIFEDDAPEFTFENTSGNSVDINDIRFAGFEYELSDPTTLPNNVQPVVVPTEAIASVSR